MMDELNSIILEKVAISQLKVDEIDKMVPIYLDAFSGMKSPALVKQWMYCNLNAFPQKACFGAWYDSLLLGYVVWSEKGGFRDEAIWELEQVAVLGQYRRQGIGTRLIHDSLAWIQDDLMKRGGSLKLVMVTTGKTNEFRKLYEKVLGAKEETVIKDLYEGDEQILIARFKQTTRNVTGREEGLLRLEYSECQNGYNSRDKIVPDEVRYVGFMFVVLTAVLLFAVDLIGSSPALFTGVVILVGILGLSFLLGFLLDIQSNLSCKRALRERSKAIEQLLSPKSGDVTHPPLSIWRYIIPGRDKYKYWEEKKLKRPFSQILPEQEGNYFLWAVRVAIILWMAVVVLTIIYGPNIT